MSKQFLTRIVTASAAASLLAFSAVLPAKADGVITLEGDITPSCILGANISPADSLIYNPTTRELDLASNVSVDVTTTVDNLYLLSGTVTAFTRGGSSYSRPVYKLTGSIPDNTGNTTPTLNSSSGAFSNLPLGVLTNSDFTLGGSIGPQGGGSFLSGRTNTDGTPVNFSLQYSLTCAPTP